MDVLQMIFIAIGRIITSFALVLNQIFVSAVDVIYDGEELTVIGVFILIGLGTGLLLWGFNFIRKLIRIRRG